MTELDPLAAQLLGVTLERIEKRLDQLEDAVGGLGAAIAELAENQPSPPRTKN